MKVLDWTETSGIYSNLILASVVPSIVPICKNLATQKSFIHIHNYVHIRTKSFGAQSYLGNRNRLPYTDLPITSNVNIMQCVGPLPGGNRLIRDVEGGLPHLLSEAWACGHARSGWTLVVMRHIEPVQSVAFA